MVKKLLLNPAEEDRLVKLISHLERRTTGEIRIHLIRKTSRAGVLSDARAVFSKLKMDQTQDHNGVLILVAEKSRELACIGDRAIHERVSAEFWQNLVHEIESHFRKGDYFIGLSKALEKVGLVLSQYFPSEGVKTNQLPDEISRS